MKIKMNLQKLEAFHLIITWILSEYECLNMADKLLHEIIDKMNDKVAAKIKKVSNRTNVGANLSLTSIEAKALYCFYSQLLACNYDFSQYHYEKLVTDSVVWQIDKEYV